MGQSSKLKSPCKDPYVITEVKSPLLFKIIDKENKESVVHLDRIKLCKDLDHSGWAKRIRKKNFNKNNGSSGKTSCVSSSATSESDDIISDIPNLFNSTDDTSDVLMDHQNKTNKADSVAVREQEHRIREQRRKERPKNLSDYVHD